jgi:hypothetical protein
MKATWALLMTLCVTLGTSGVALADGTTPGPTYTTHVVDIVGRRVQPIAAVEVTRALPSVKLHEMKPPFAQRIEAGVAHDPF